MSEDILLRDYLPHADFDEVFAFSREIIGQRPDDGARDELIAYPTRHMVAKVAADNTGNLIGFCAATHPYWCSVAMIDYLVVASGSRRRGVGRRLVSDVEAVLRKARIRHVCVQTASWNGDAIRFYERLGYARLAALTEYLGEGNDAVWLSRRLSPTRVRLGPGSER